ncbi:hypothetical protein [Nostoc foliaceum]|uniref:Uncharacterized protein n=2 Tax=Nostoc TaxID=1177 RepID=A0ABR8IH69_9NOSO|nr:hypothetical protein [Nostoc foliaceum]MBD2564807.1 hypothetical protein [Nostoc linckia FACHB-391]MBD2650519.1 hypothetical protein [Nostoc foliaceum FACHB-393]
MKMYDLGIYDMKVGLVLSIFAVEAILAHKLTRQVAPIILINSDEKLVAIN